MFTKIYKKQGGKTLSKNSKHREIGKEIKSVAYNQEKTFLYVLVTVLNA